MSKNKKKKSGGQKRRRINPIKKVRYCDPGACHCCQYVGSIPDRCVPGKRRISVYYRLGEMAPAACREVHG